VSKNPKALGLIDKPIRMQLQELLFSQGFGTRRICQGLIEHGHTRLGLLESSIACDDPWHEVQVQRDWPFVVQGQQWFYWPKAYLMMHKPAATECSQKPSHWPSVYSLLPAALRQRPQKSAVQGVQAVGRLDQDTTGLLLMTDDGALIHQLASPKYHVPKVYDLITQDPIDDLAIERLLAGVVLNDSPQPVRAQAIARQSDRALQMTLTQGKYHQVKRMLASVGHLVVGLHRSKIGQLSLPHDLLPGQWRALSLDQLDLIKHAPE
jgi:16S rRNA pseudouridine516 synthase